MAVKKVENFNVHETPATNQNEFDVETYLNANWGKTKEAVNNNAEELMQAQKDISTLKKDNKTNKSSIDVLEKSNETINKSLEDIDTKDKKQDEDIKANKESIEALQTENIEIKSENERLREDIKSIAIVGEENGESIHIEDSSDARCEIEIGGNHQQDTRSGKNRIDLSKVAVGTKNGVTAKYNASNNSIMLNGTCTQDNTLFSVSTLNIPFFTNKTTMTVQMLDGAVSGGYVGSRFSDADYSHVFSLNISELNQNNKKLYRTEALDGTYARFDFRIDKDVVLNNFTIQVMLTDEVDTEYEMYGASPSINYPSPIKAIGDVRNILDMRNAKGGNNNGITCTMNADGSYQYAGKATNTVVNVWLLGAYGTDLPEIFTLEAGTYYINDAYIFDGTSALNADANKKIYTFINEHKITGVRAPAAVVGQEYNEIKYPIIAKIGHEIPWIPYDCGYAKVDIFNKNYLSTIPRTTFSLQGIQTTFDGEKFTCKGTAMYNYFNLVTQRIQQHFKAGTYTFSSNMFAKGRACMRFYYEDGTADTYYSNINTRKISFTLKKDAYEYFLMVDGLTVGGGDVIDCIIKLQLEDGNTSTEIIKAENQEFVVDVQLPMFEGDKFIKTDGKWYEKHCVKTEIMSAFPTTNIEVCGTFANFQINRNIVLAFVRDDLKITNVRNDILCDKLKANANSMWNGIGNGIQTYLNNNKILISIPFGDIEKNFGEELTINNYSQAFRKYINDNGPFKIYYLLAEPELIECTEAQSKVLDEIYSKAHTYKNITNISAESSEVNPTLNIKYLKDPETEHNKLQAQIDEIKELLSSTTTSAMLLNNMQTDLESEV